MTTETRDLQNLNCNNFKIMNINSIFIKVYFFLIFLVTIIPLYGQNENIFLERSLKDKEKFTFERLEENNQIKVDTY